MDGSFLLTGFCGSVSVQGCDWSGPLCFDIECFIPQPVRKLIGNVAYCICLACNMLVTLGIAC